jgi:hypothetical protein
MTSFAHETDILSPELALVDAALAAVARSRLSGTPEVPEQPRTQAADASERVETERCVVVASRAPELVGVKPVSLATFEASQRQTEAALRRIAALVESDESESRTRRRFRVPKLAGALATWATVLLLLADTQLVDWPQLLAESLQ